MNAENQLLAETVTKLELQVRTRFLKLMLSTQNTDKFVSLVDQYLTRFPLSFQHTQPSIPPSAQPSSKKNTESSDSQRKTPAKTPTQPPLSSEPTVTEKETEPLNKTRKLTATDRRTIRRSLPVFVKAALGKTESSQRADFLKRLEIDPVKALSRTKNTAIIFKHPRLGDISAGNIRDSFVNKESTGLSESVVSTKTPSKPQAKSKSSTATVDVHASSTPSAATPSYSSVLAGERKASPHSTASTDHKSKDSASSPKLKQPIATPTSTEPKSKPSLASVKKEVTVQTMPDLLRSKTWESETLQYLTENNFEVPAFEKYSAEKAEELPDKLFFIASDIKWALTGSGFVPEHASFVSRDRY